MSVYYNEWDPKAAAWIRELIRLGLAPDGEVDERSILEVDEVDLWGFDQHHFFAGIGGWPFALRLAGLEGVKGIMTGSPPCQPFSAAGQQKGKDDERHLAPKFIELVRAVRPRVLFGEQVASAAVFGKAAGSTRKRAGAEPAWAWLDDLSDRLEAAHYAVGTSDIPAAGVGAPHIRQRTFFGAVDLEWVANDSGSKREWVCEKPHGESISSGQGVSLGGCRDDGGMADAPSKQHDGGGYSGERRRSEHPDSGTDRRMAVSSGRECSGRSNLQERNLDFRSDTGWTKDWGDSESHSIGGGVADSLEPGLEGHAGDGDRSGEPGRVKTGSDGPVAPEGGAGGMGYAASESGERDTREVSTKKSGEYAAGIAEYGRVSVRPEHASESVDEQSGWPSATNGPWGDVDWLFCRDGKWRPVIGTHEPMDDGVPTRMVQGRNLFHPLTEGEEARVPRLKGYGNAIVPQVAAVFIESFMESLWWIR